MNKGFSERGQVLVLIILAIALIFGAAALAVDVGQMYSERRRAQSAADSAAYAAAFAASQGDNYQTSGLASVQLNGYPDDNPEQELAEKLDVQIKSPPISGKYIGKAGYYQVIIRKEVDKVFSQFVYSGPWFIQVEAVVHSTAKRAFADGNTIVATCATCCDAFEIFGNPDVIVNGGNITSNSKGSSSASCASGEYNGTGCIDINNGGMYLGGAWDPGSSSTCKDADGNTIPAIQVDNGIKQNQTDLWSETDPGMPGCLDPDTGEDLPEFTSAKYDEIGVYDSTAKEYVLSPGIYEKGISVSGKNTTVRFNPGMYCLDGDLDVPSGSVIGTDVMFVMRKNSSFRINSSESVTLTAPGTAKCIDDPKFFDEDEDFCWSGWLIYMPYSNSGEVQLGGGNSTNYEGTIYAPGPRTPASQDKCTLIGNSETIGFKASIICYNVNVGGKGTVNITYYDKINAQQPAMIELAK